MTGDGSIFPASDEWQHGPAGSESSQERVGHAQVPHWRGRDAGGAERLDKGGSRRCACRFRGAWTCFPTSSVRFGRHTMGATEGLLGRRLAGTGTAFALKRPGAR